MISLIFFIFGITFGSFLNVLIHRIPKDQNIAFPASSCPNCGVRIKKKDNIPILSYFLLKGKCSSCNQKISIRYPIVEFLGGLIFVFTYLKFGIIEGQIIENISAILLISIIFSLLLALSVIDFAYKEVPDSLNLSALTLAFFSNGFEIGNIIVSVQNGLIFAGGFSLLRFYVSYFKKAEALGEADIMISATIGAILGLKLGFLALFLSAILAIIGFIAIGKKDYELPFIPFLMGALAIIFYFNDFFLKLLEYLYG